MAIQFDNTNTGVATLKPATSGTLTLTLPSADGTTGQAIVTNGSGQLSFATPSGGVTGFTGAESTSAPNATVSVDSLTAAAASANADVAFVAKGTGATLAQVPTSTAAGGDKRGTYATDWQKSRSVSNQVASGTYSTIGGGLDNKANDSACVVGGGSGNTASNSNATAGGGTNNLASGSESTIGGGISNTASSTAATVSGGQSNTASGSRSTVSGGQANTASSGYSFVSGGYYGTTRSIIGYHVFPACAVPIASAAGVSQSGLLILGRETTNATATVLTSDTNAASTTNQVILPNNSAYYFRGSVVAGVTGAGNSSMWSFEGGIKRGANAAATTLINSVTNLVAQDSGASAWVVALAADTTNGGFKVTVTGAASTTIRWVCKIETIEMTF
jgi:hypothetical protein